MFSLSEENYLKVIHNLKIANSKNASTTLIAKELQTKASSVTDMLKKLADKKLVNYQKYKGVSLTKKGENIALNIVRKHRLWEVFLVDTLHFNCATVLAACSVCEYKIKASIVIIVVCLLT